MRINPKCKLREVAGEHIVLIQGERAGELTRLAALNSTSVLLWNRLIGKDFEVEEVQRALLEEFEVDSEKAMQDAVAWVNVLNENHLLA